MMRRTENALIETLISRALRLGVYASSLLMLAGFIGALFHPEVLSRPEGYPPFTEHLSLLETDSEYFIRLLNPFTFFYFGILVLLLTPIVRVVIAIVSFVLGRDARFTTISLTVLFIIILSVYLAFTRV
jgi:uncharacterized membrane protein